MKTPNLVMSLIPILDWGRRYRVEDFRHDLLAGVVVLFITIPQVIAYAYLAGVPAELGLYTAVLSLLGYALFGGSRTMAVGPAAIIAMMTLEAASRYAEPQTAEYIMITVKLAFMTGVMLIVLRILNFGAVTSFLSHAVVTGFVTAAAILIIVSQFSSILGIDAAPATSFDVVISYIAMHAAGMNVVVLAISMISIGLLIFARVGLKELLVRAGLREVAAESLARAAPMFVVVVAIGIVALFGLDTSELVPVVGIIPGGLPAISLTWLSLSDIRSLLPSALLISMVIFLESVSIGTAVASKRRQKINPNQELVGLGVANLGASIVGGFPVAGSFARTVVNFSTGAATQVACLITAALVLLVVVTFASLFYHLPKAVLSAVIVVSAWQLVDRDGIRKIFRFNPIDGVTFAFTFFSVLLLGVELGILVGIVISFVLLIRASSKPHIAVVGRWGDTEHFRNILRHEVTTSPAVLAVRIDESLYFVNTRYIETFLLNKVAESKEIKHVLLICTATNFIDSAGLEMLEMLSDNLKEVDVTLHLSEVKGPVMDKLKETEFYNRMGGKVFFTTDIAMREIADI